jgi:thioredoxin-related protein
MTRKLLALSIAATVSIFAVTALSAAELLMLEQPGCPWCARFDDEIAPAWPRTEEGRRAPLRRVDITEPWPDDLTDIRMERFTPTFILVDRGEEIGRLRGYVGDEFFWYQVGELIGKLPPEDG